MNRRWSARRGGRKPAGGAGPYAFALLLVAIAIGVATRFPESPRAPAARPPYGIPEFVVEVPPGYEDLLPPDPASATPPAVPFGARGSARIRGEQVALAQHLLRKPLQALRRVWAL